MDLVEAVAPAVRSAGPRFVSQFDVLGLLDLYEVGRGFLTPKNHQRWKETFAIGVSLDGVFAGIENGIVTTLAVFWRTDNPNVDPNIRPPIPRADGHYAYVCWLWNAVGQRGIIALKSHIKESLPGVRYIAHHDQRARLKDKARNAFERARGDGRLIVKPLVRELSEAAAKIIAERNGHG